MGGTEGIEGVRQAWRKEGEKVGTEVIERSSIIKAFRSKNEKSRSTEDETQ
jgi:hypothetical protein